MRWPRARHTATLLDNNNVLVAGGYDSEKLEDGSIVTRTYGRVEKYDPALGTWSDVVSMTAPRRYHTATLLTGGKVLVVGGDDGEVTQATTEVYDPSTSSWVKDASMSSPRRSHVATLLPGGKVLVTGGFDGSAVIAATEVYNPSSKTWSSVKPMSSARTYHKQTLLSDGKVLVTGGLIEQVKNNVDRATATAEIYDPSSNTWRSAGSMSSTRAWHTAVRLSNGKVLVAGGLGYEGAMPSETAEVYDPVSNSWSRVGAMTSPRSHHIAMLLPNNKVLVSGGRAPESKTYKLISESEVYDPLSSTWKSAGSMGSTRGDHSATLLNSGRVLVVGGLLNADKAEFFPQKEAELYTP